MCKHTAYYIDKNVLKTNEIVRHIEEKTGFGRGLIKCYDCNKTLKDIMDSNENDLKELQISIRKLIDKEIGYDEEKYSEIMYLLSKNEVIVSNPYDDY